MYNSMFGAGGGPTAFAYDMMVLEDIEAEEEDKCLRKYDEINGDNDEFEWEDDD